MTLKFDCTQGRLRLLRLHQEGHMQQVDFCLHPTPRGEGITYNVLSECTYIHSLTLASGVDVRLLRKLGGEVIAQLRGIEEQEAAGSDRRQKGILQLDSLSPIL